MIRNEKQLLIAGVFISLLSLLIIASLYLASVISAIMFKSVLLGTLLAIFNFGIGFALIRFSLNKSEKIFILSLWGGLLLRLILGLILILITLIFLEINTYGFIFSILFFYVFYLIIEIFYLNLGRKSQFGSRQ
jgi:hypothetical protein